MKAGFVGLVGMPNSGKSTFMNFVVQEKVSIVSPKPQTTRRRIQGILTVKGKASEEKLGQLVFVDAPGMIEAKRGLNHFLEVESQDVIQSSDAVIGFLNVDEEKKENIDTVIQKVRGCGKPYLFMITKIDDPEHSRRKSLIRNLLGPEDKIFEVGYLHQKKDVIIQKSINENSDINGLIQGLLELVPESKGLLYDEEEFTTENTRDLVAEFIREQCLVHLHQELPFQMAVQVHKFDEDADPCPKIDVNLIVTKDGHKRIVIGKGGEMIKTIGTDSRKEIEKLLGQKIFLNLNVIVRDNWDENPLLMKELKYVLQNR